MASDDGAPHRSGERLLHFQLNRKNLALDDLRLSSTLKQVLRTGGRLLSSMSLIIQALPA
jgi:hypothetical protein